MPRTDASRPPAWLDARHRRLLGWAALVGLLAGLTVLAFALGARLLAALLALAMLAATPVLGVGPALDWWRHRRPHRRRHRHRPESFPRDH
ncbi:hypothetical protein [Roseicella frigidaeris]|uniref:hypothetical protein n=1 Tax=Roseicella frigidaeris TaxID=2230885 RepID=UPI001401C68B|nr:hypothetical protein [Roseicella frigidaeris]